MAEKRSETATGTQENASARRSDEGRQERGIARRSSQSSLYPQSSLLTNPFSLLGRMVEEMNSVFDELSSPGFGQSGALGARSAGAYSPSIDVFQRGNELVVRADLPGLKPDDINVEVSDDAITLSGERQEEHRDERQGGYRFERSYGSFYRTIPLPEGTITDQAKAHFNHGVLEITVPAPPEQVSRGRRLEISSGEEKKSTSK